MTRTPPAPCAGRPYSNAPGKRRTSPDNPLTWNWMMKRYLCVWFPDWPLTRLRRAVRARKTGSAKPGRGKPPEPHLPFVLIESGAHGPWVVLANAPACRLGVTAGLAFTDAKARAPGLAFEEIDRAADARSLRQVADWLVRFSPLVALAGEDVLMLETTGCDHLHGGERAMMDRLSALLDRNGLPHRLGLAGTQGAASVLAHAAPGMCLDEGSEHDGLAGLPVSALRLSDEAETLLRRFGLTRIGQLYGIDRKALARRFQSRSAADAVLLRLDQALGLRHEPLAPLRPVPLRSARLPCPEPIATSEAITMGLEQLASDLCKDLSAAGLGARVFCLTAFRADGTRSEATIKAARPVRSPPHILRLFRERIDGIDPGFGIDLLILEAHRTDVMEVGPMALSGNLAATQTDEVALSALADRLVARLGEGAVSILRPEESHLPERTRREVLFDGALPRAAPRARVTGPRPIRILDHRESVTVLAGVPDGPPQRFIWRRLARIVTRADGPERISPEWWMHTSLPGPAPRIEGSQPTWLTPRMDPRADALDIARARTAFNVPDEDPGHVVKFLPRARDYYRVEDAGGRRYWLFRYGLYGDGRGGAPEWYVHGLFA
jgi:protein ImuB